jgi:phage terminase Nu1 subunit (DNA packaging protein)
VPTRPRGRPGRPLTNPSWVYRLRTGLGLTREQAAALVGNEPRTWQAWETRETPCVGPARRLLLLMERHPSVRRWLAAMADETAEAERAERDDAA